MKRLWCFTTMLVLSLTAHAQSVDCSAKTKLTVTERTICHNPNLSAMNNRLNKLYQQALQVSLQLDALKQDQLVWLRNNRDLCANDKKCLTTAYQQRLQLLTTVIANPKAPIPQYYPVRWDHSINLPPRKPSPDYPKFVNLDHSSNIVNRGLNSKNPCVQMFLQQSVPAQQSYVAAYQFTKDTLDELPPNISATPDLNYAQLVSGFLAGLSQKVMDPSAKIIYLSPYELIFTHNVSGRETETSDSEAIKIKVIAWGHFKDKVPNQLEDMLLYTNENWLAATFSYVKKHRQWTKNIWDGWGDGGIFDFRTYIIATRKAHEARIRTKGFYKVVDGKCSPVPWMSFETAKIGGFDNIPLRAMPTFNLQFPH